MEAAERIADRLIGGGENDAGGADGGADGAGLENSHANGARALIAGTRNDGCACEEAGGGSGGLA